MSRLIKVEIAPVWRFQRSGETRGLKITLDLLSDIRSTGKLSVAAARSVGGRLAAPVAD